MRFWMTGMFASALTGLVWVGLWHLVLTMMAILATGAALPLALGPAAFSGLVAGVFAALQRPALLRNRRMTGIILIACLLFSFSLGTPFDPESLLAPWQSLLLLVLASAAGWLSIEKTVGPANAGFMTRYGTEEFYLRLFWGLGLMMFVLIVAVPFYVMVMTSLKSQHSLMINPLDFSIDYSLGVTKLLSSYIELFTDYGFMTLLVNSAVVSVATVIITLLFSVPGAYAVAKLRFPGRKWLSGSVLLIYLIPAIILVIPLYAIFSQLGMRNSLFALCIVYPATTIPVAVYMLRGYFAGLPSDLDDAGLMDGLSRLQIITNIAMPLSMPAIASVALYVFMIAWNEFLFAFMFLDDVKLFTLSRGIVSLNSSEVPRQHLMAGAVIATAPVLFLFLWFERFLVSGLTAGSVKG
ncbi:MAG TPA: ABC transporter permease [Alphaproteobacteria bacterium]|jgi:multiple sugar transport system permease protein|nr:ABC transporter permease [Alphaproteobacteria bacterium]|tara:strand:- start:307 stop:1536 length:1230 start_codon:yes stop_codon:yes gene_type:complete